MANAENFKVGDKVKHIYTGEEWVIKVVVKSAGGFYRCDNKRAYDIVWDDTLLIKA